MLSLNLGRCWELVPQRRAAWSEGGVGAAGGASGSAAPREEGPRRSLRVRARRHLSSLQEKVLAWTFSTKDYVYGKLYENRVTLSGNAEESDASITINQLTMDDNGTYECSISLLNDLDGVSKARVRLLVLGECPLFLW